MNSVHIGASEWYYKDWHASFYRLLTAKAVADWKKVLAEITRPLAVPPMKAEEKRQEVAA